MAQDIIYNKKTYKSVPAVELPTTSGEKASFIDTSDGTATAGDIAKDKIAYVGGEKIIGTHALLSKIEIEKTVELDFSDGNQVVSTGGELNLWTTDQSYPLSNGIMYDPDTEIYTVPTTAEGLMAEIYTLPQPIPANTNVRLTVSYLSGKSSKGSVIVGAYHKGSDGNSWEPDSGKIAINADLAGTKKSNYKNYYKICYSFYDFC